MTPIRNDPGLFRNPHAKCIGPARLKQPPHRKKSRNKVQIDLIKEALHHKLAWSARER